MRKHFSVQSCTPLTGNPDHNPSPENTTYSPGNNPGPATGKLIYRSEKGPLTDFLQVETEDCDLAAWFMLPEHKCWPVEIRLMKKNGEPCFRMLFTGWHIHTCQIAYYWYRARKKAGPYITRGMALLAGIIRRGMGAAV
jgi:hypothetical protein